MEPTTRRVCGVLPELPGPSGQNGHRRALSVWTQVPYGTHEHALPERDPHTRSKGRLRAAARYLQLMGLAGALFFARGHLLQGLEAHRQRLVREVEAAPEAHVLKVDEAQWARALFDRYTVEAPVLKREDAFMEELRPAQVDVSRESSRLIRSGPTYVPGHKTVAHVPFTGEKDIFHFLPSSHILVQLNARVTDGELLIDIEYPDDRPLDTSAYTGRFIERVETNLTDARADIAKFNSDLEELAMNAIVARRARIEEHLAYVATTGLPIKNKLNAEKASIPEVITRRAAPLLPTLREGEPMELEPVLLNEHYEHILSVIRQHTRSMERDPQAYASMGEEARRRVILDALNTHYQGTGSAEAFNFGGKTDILISYEGRSLFIAECKFWSGAKGFTHTIDQLFGYHAWRDTKLAILMFVRERGLSTIIERAREALEAHPQFVVWKDISAETELRATVSWKGDERRHADLAVLFVSTPVG